MANWRFLFISLSFCSFFFAFLLQINLENEKRPFHLQVDQIWMLFDKISSICSDWNNFVSIRSIGGFYFVVILSLTFLWTCLLRLFSLIFICPLLFVRWPQRTIFNIDSNSIDFCGHRFDINWHRFYRNGRWFDVNVPRLTYFNIYRRYFVHNRLFRSLIFWGFESDDVAKQNVRKTKKTLLI